MATEFSETKDTSQTPSTHSGDSLPSPLAKDVEAADNRQAMEDDGKPHYPVWQWVLTLVGLYMGALLYGS